MSPGWTGVIRRRCKLACKRLLIASVQFGESQTPRKSGAFSRWPGRVSGTVGKLACKRLLIASVQFGESQTPRKSKAFSRWPGRSSGTIGKLACKRLLIASVQFGESQTPRKSGAFSRWPGRRSGRTNMARFLTMHTMFDFFSKNIVFIYIL